MNKIELSLQYARILLDSVGLSSWAVGTNKSRSVIAIMNHDKKTIDYSDRYIKIASVEDFRRVTMHEATHALLGKGKGHNKEFAELCTRLYPDEPFSGACISAPIQTYKVSCPRCNHHIYSNKKETGYCMLCASNGSGVYKLDISINKLDPRQWASTP